jgi:TP901 family phage tail tape measure protein
MAIVNEARAVLTAEDRASAVLAMVARNFDKLDRAASRLDANGAGARRQQVVEQHASRTAVLTQRMGAAALRATGPLVGLFGAYGAARMVNGANKEFYQNERAMTRIAVTADASAESQAASWTQLQQLARETALPIDKVRDGLDALVASGRSLPEAMAFLPAVAQTAQASGAEVADIAKTADAVGESFKISGDKMQNAFDIMAAGGKAGKFELKDMARYLPSLGPATAALGFKGEKGLADLVAMLQVMRKGAGTSEEAVGSMSNILNKMESDKTAKEFKKLGVDSEEAFKKARKEGRNLVEVFEELLQKATKGDASKIGEIIDDQEFKRGAVALMQFRGEWQKLSQTMQTSSAGTVAQDLARVTSNSQATFDRFKNAADRLADSLGRRLSPAFKGVADAATSAMDAVNGALLPGETEEQRLARFGNDRPRTRAEQRIDDARRAERRQKLLDDPSSEIYGMRDGGWAGARRSRPAPRPHVNLLNDAHADRQRMLAEQATSERRERDAARARFLADERKQAEEERLNPRGHDAYRDVDALSRARKRVRQESDALTAGDLLAGRGEAGVTLQASFMKLVQEKNREAVAGKTGTTAVSGSTMGGGTHRLELQEAIYALLSQTSGGKAPEAGIVDAMFQKLDAAATALAGRLTDGSTDRTNVDGWANALKGALGDQIKAEVKPDQITAKADVDVTSSVKVEVVPTPDFWAKVDARVTSQSSRSSDTRGISLPGKETSGGGGGGGGAH